MVYKQSSNSACFLSYLNAKQFLNTVETQKKGTGRIDKKSEHRWIVRYWL